MLTGNFYWIYKLFLTIFTSLLRFISLELFNVVRLFVKIWVHDSLPSLMLLFLKILFHLPSRFIIAAVVQVNAAVAEGARPCIMPVLAQTGIIIKPACVFRPASTRVSGGSMLPFVILKWIFQLVFSKLIVSIIVGSSVYLCAQFAILDLLCNLYILEVSLFGLFLLIAYRILTRQYFLLMLFVSTSFECYVF